MTPEEALHKVRTELETGIELTKCQQCSCMDDMLKPTTPVPSDRKRLRQERSGFSVL